MEIDDLVVPEIEMIMRGIRIRVSQPWLDEGMIHLVINGAYDWQEEHSLLHDIYRL